MLFLYPFPPRPAATSGLPALSVLPRRLLEVVERFVPAPARLGGDAALQHGGGAEADVGALHALAVRAVRGRRMRHHFHSVGRKGTHSQRGLVLELLVRRPLPA